MLEIFCVSKRYEYQKVLDSISMQLPEQGFIAIVGPSGCGKSTLLHIIGGIDQEFEGELIYQGQSVKRHLTRYRQKHVSFIFQQFHLIMWLTVQQNIELSQFFQKIQKSDISLDISEFQNVNMQALSLGQRQRIAYLRAYFQQADILLCDEPTGSLDPQHANQVMQLLKEESQKKLVILVSHDMKLVEKYSDQIYEMRDGKIVHHEVRHECFPVFKYEVKKSRKFFPLIRIAFMSFVSHKSRSLQLIFGLTLSFLCILLTFMLSQGLEKQIYDYIYSLVPPSSISFQSRHHQSLSLDSVSQFKRYPDITRVQLYLDEYECLGIGFVGERYQESQVLFIGDDTSPYADYHLYTGEYPQKNHEILVSLSTAKHLCQEQDISELIGKKVYAWYQYQNQIKSIAYKVVGITNQTTALDTFYQMENAYIDLLAKTYSFNPEHVLATLGILYVEKTKDCQDVLQTLQIAFPDYKFLEVGATTFQNISQTMKQVKIVFLFFSGLAILSSLFLIGEVMFLNIVQKRKDLAIMACFGAGKMSLMRFVLYESFLIVGCAQIMSTFLYLQILSIINTFLKEGLLNENFVLSFDFVLLIKVFGGSFLLVLLSQLPPLFYVFKLNMIKALKN